jgi:hypothetical protein
MFTAYYFEVEREAPSAQRLVSKCLDDKRSEKSHFLCRTNLVTRPM